VNACACTQATSHTIMSSNMLKRRTEPDTGAKVLVALVSGLTRLRSLDVWCVHCITPPKGRACSHTAHKSMQARSKRRALSSLLCCQTVQNTSCHLTDLLLLHRKNQLGLPGWRHMIAGLGSHTALESLNGLSCVGLVSGGLRSLEVTMGGSLEGGRQGEEEGLAAALVQMLSRSASCLTKLDFRYRGSTGLNQLAGQNIRANWNGRYGGQQSVSRH
jgi:hypothetical protein